MVEIIVAMVIMGILLAVLGSKFLAPRTSVRNNEARVAAGMYFNAIQAFKSDHAGRLPLNRFESPTQIAACGTPTLANCEWPYSSWGPVDDSGKPYITQIPDMAKNERLGFIIHNQMGAPAGQAHVDKVANPDARIEYIPLGDNEFELQVLVADKSSPGGTKLLCRINTTAAISDRKC